MRGLSREQMVEMVKSAGREVERRAEDLVGDMDGMTDMDIWLRFSLDELPKIDVSRSYVSKESFNVLLEQTKRG